LDRFAVASLRSPESGNSCPSLVAAARSRSLRVFASYGVLYAILVALSSTSSAVRPRIPFVVRAFPRITGPFRLTTEVHPPMEWIPCRAPHYLLAVRPVGRTDFLEIPRPFNDIPWASPAWTARHDRPVPFSGFEALRPRPLNGFPASPKFAALFQAAPFLGFLPSGSSPHRRSLTPLDAAWLPCGYPPVCRGARLESLSPPVSPTPTLSRSCLVPPSAMSSLSARRSTLPGCSGSRAVEPPRSTSITRFEASIPPASPFATGSGLPSPTGRYPLGLLPL